MVRLWIVVSLIWIGGMWLVMRPDQDAMRYWQVRANLIEVERQAVTVDDNPYIEDEDPDRWLDYELRTAAKKAVEARENAHRRAQLRFIRGKLAAASGAIFLPSLALLLFGAALYWVAIGFRREEP